jgi:DNA repair protein RadD
MKITLFPYQQKGLNEVFQAMRDGFKKILLVLAMGLGKTTLMGAIIQMGYLRGKKVLIVVHRDNLVRQFAKRLINQFDVPSGLILGNEKKQYQLPIQVGSRQSLARRLQYFPPDHFDLIVIDEAHYAAGAEYTKIIEHFHQAKLVGITATPFRSDGKSMKAIFDKLVHPIKCKEAIEQGYLCSAEYIGIGEIDMTGVSIKKGDYDEDEMYARFSEWDITPHVVEEIKKADGQSIVFCINVAHTIEVSEAIKQVGIKTAYVTGLTKIADREIIYEKFNNNQIQVLCNCEILTEGADFPPVINIFLVKKTKSIARYLQAIGRGARTYKELLYVKPGFKVIDFGGNVVMHGYFEDYDEDLTLEDGVEKKTRKVKPRKCPQCQRVILGKECTKCGFLFEEDEKEKIIIGSLEMVVLTKNMINYTRLSKKKWEKVKDNELRLYAKIKGMKNGWALHQYAERHGIPKNDHWHIHVNNILSQLEKENNQDYE